jgi:hypothetical protein
MAATPRVIHRVLARRSRRLGAGLVAAMTVLLSACFTGERPRLVEGATSTGDAAADAVLNRLEVAGDAAFTGDYEVVTKFGDVTTPATVVQAGPARRAITIGDVRFIVDGADTATCDLGSDSCSTTIDAARVSNLQLTPDFYAASPAARLRRDTEQRAGPTRASSETIAGQPATCVVITTTEGESTYCALDSGPLARLEAADLSIELTDYSPTPDESQFEQRD